MGVPAPRRVAGLTVPAVIAHRGAPVGCAENTASAFDTAVLLGADMVEMDVRLTADGVPVVAHDPMVATPSGEAAAVSELTLADLHAIPEHAGIITLREVLTRLAGRCAVEIEIKHLPDEPGDPGLAPAAAQAVGDLLRELQFAAALISCFERTTLDHVRRALPAAVTGLETEGVEAFGRAIDVCARDGHSYVLPDVAAVLAGGRAMVDRANSQGVRVMTWVADDPGVVEALFALGVDAVESDDTVTAVTVRDAVRARLAATAKQP